MEAGLAPLIAGTFVAASVQTALHHLRSGALRQVLLLCLLPVTEPACTKRQPKMFDLLLTPEKTQSTQSVTISCSFQARSSTNHATLVPMVCTHKKTP